MNVEKKKGKMTYALYWGSYLQWRKEFSTDKEAIAAVQNDKLYGQIQDGTLRLVNEMIIYAK